MIDITFIYSSPCKEALKNLVESIVKTFNVPNLSIEDMFWYGVFCAPETYANYELWDEVPDNIEVPPTITSVCSKEDERIDFVKQTINDIITGNMEKPEWMIFVEEEKSCNKYEMAPSTFLRIIPKNNEYKDLAEKLIEFLYSVNLTITAVKW